MAKKQWTDEERLAFGVKMKAARQNKNPQNETQEAPEPASITPEVPANEQVEQPDIKQGATISSNEYAELMKQIEEIKSGQFSELLAAIKGSQQAGTSVANGKLTGTVEKYLMSPKNYPSPIERLKEEKRLARFAFPINYELDYEVGVSEYTTIDNIRTREPKFTLTLIRIMMDEETGEPTNGRYEICRLIMHEDPEAALVIAREQDLEVNEEDEKQFLDEMRYIRMRDWLLECFYSAQPSKKSNKREMVIDGKLVNYYEVNDEAGGGIGKLNWDNLPRIKF